MARRCCRFALAHVHTDDLASQAASLRDLRQQLNSVMGLAIAGKADTINHKADALLADSHLLLTRLLPQYRAVPKLEGKGRWLRLCCGDGQKITKLHFTCQLINQLQLHHWCKWHDTAYYVQLSIIYVICTSRPTYCFVLHLS